MAVGTVASDYSPPSYASHFSKKNIPFGIASSKKRPSPQAVTRIEDTVIFLSDLLKAGGVADNFGELQGVFSQPTLNAFAAKPKEVQRQVRKQIQEAADQALKDSSEHINDVQMHLPVSIGDYTDFSCSRDHMSNAGEAISGARALPASFLSYPVAYGGRASTIQISGEPVPRPYGQYIEDYTAAEKKAIFGPERALDYELEIGAIIGNPVKRNERPKAADADEYIFGLVLLNDWSARGIQGFEMNPLGPFNGKNFGTSISPWVITLDALEPYRVPAPAHEAPITAFLDDPKSTNFDMNLTVEVIRNGSATTTCEVNYDTMYWTFRQMLAHHTVSGCGLNAGDILGSGTVSSVDQHGCLLEITKGGKVPMKLNDGSELRYLEDGDIVRFTGVFGDGKDGVGFGECVGQVTHLKL